MKGKRCGGGRKPYYKNKRLYFGKGKKPYYKNKQIYLGSALPLIPILSAVAKLLLG